MRTILAFLLIIGNSYAYSNGNSYPDAPDKPLKRPSFVSPEKAVPVERYNSETFRNDPTVLIAEASPLQIKELPETPKEVEVTPIVDVQPIIDIEPTITVSWEEAPKMEELIQESRPVCNFISTNTGGSCKEWNLRLYWWFRAQGLHPDIQVGKKEGADHMWLELDDIIFDATDWRYNGKLKEECPMYEVGSFEVIK